MKAKIREGRSFFCDQYKQKKFALMQEGQTLSAAALFIARKTTVYCLFAGVGVCL